MSSNLRRQLNEARKGTDTNQLQKERRHRAIKHLIEEAVVNALKEQEMEQQAQQPAPEPEAPPVANSEQGQEDIAQQQQEQETYTVDDMISDLNAIRGGRSFTDPEVYGKLVTFFKSLSDQDYDALDRLLTQIAELVTGAEDEAQPEQPVEQPGAEGQPPQPQGGDAAAAPQQSAPMPGAQQGAGAAGVGA